MAAAASRMLHGIASVAMCLLALLLLVSPVVVNAWWDLGHMTIPEIALRHMNPENVEKLQTLVGIHSVVEQFPKSPDAVQAGPWADDIKSMGLRTMSSWHFITTPYQPDADYQPNPPVPKENVESVVDSLQKAVTNKGASVGTIAYAVMNLIHFIGDIHQPLHTTNEYSNQYPNGDRGGNAQVVFLNPEKTVSQKLHMFWDSMGQGPQESFPRPLSAKDYQTVVDFADALEAEYSSTFTDAQKLVTKGSTMALDSREIATTFAYPGITNGTVLTDEYQTKARDHSNRLVTLAGYRLATVMDKILAGVSMDTIQAGIKAVEATVPTTGNGNSTGSGSVVNNYYGSDGNGKVSAGATAGIAIATFCVGAIFAAAVTAVVAVTCTRCRSAKEPASFSEP